MGNGAATLMKPSEKKEHAVYVATKIDADVMRRVKAAAALDGRTVQEWLSDVANGASSEAINLPPIKRKPQPPHPKRPKS